MNQRAYNFNAGPAALPLEVLRQAQAEFVDFQETGMSIMEMSHRSKVYESVHQETQQLIKKLMQVPDNYHVLFLQGGASTQFAMVPMNFLREGLRAAYVVTGSWAKKAIAEAKLFGETVVAAHSDGQYIPEVHSQEIPSNAAYLHVTSNETIDGIQYGEFPRIDGVPLIADMSSDIMSRPVDVSSFAMIYAGAQKNMGPSGVTVVLLRDDLVQDTPSHIPTMLRYDTYIEQNSLYNTPPVYSIYMMNLMLKWLEQGGGLRGMEARNREKAGLIYDTMDQSGGFYQGCARKDSRSLMNITFRLPTEELEKRFVQQSADAGFIGLQGHRSVGGLRASVYNAVPLETCRALCDFMREFQRLNG